MKKTLIIIIGLMYMTCISCEESKQEEDTPLNHQTEQLIHKIKEGDLEILEIDGCEYFVYKEHLMANQGFGYMAHKGNCNNPIHCHNQKIQSDSSNTNFNNKEKK